MFLKLKVSACVASSATRQFPMYTYRSSQYQLLYCCPLRECAVNDSNVYNYEIFTK